MYHDADDTTLGRTNEQEDIFHGIPGKTNRRRRLLGVVIDWAGVGVDGLGADAAQLLAATILFDGIGDASIAEFAEQIFADYLQGLRSAGWAGDETLARFSFAAFALVRWGINIAGLVLENLIADDPAFREATVLWLGQPIDVMLERWSALVDVLLDLADEARALLCTAGY